MIHILLFFLFSLHAHADTLLDEFKKEYNWEKDKKSIEALRMQCLEKYALAVPTLIKVMKDPTFPDKNRWMATFLLGNIMGKKASGFLAEFITNPLWMMRLAVLKALLALKETNYADKYAQALRDKSMIVRMQALENIRTLGLQQYADQVWSMLFDPLNYHAQGEKKTRMPILSQVVRAIGDLQYSKAAIALYKMLQKKEYENLIDDIDYGLSKIYKVSSQANGIEAKKSFWRSYFQNH